MSTFNDSGNLLKRIQHSLIIKKTSKVSQIEHKKTGYGSFPVDAPLNTAQLKIDRNVYANKTPIAITTPARHDNRGYP